jgi:hypothetical protein
MSLAISRYFVMSSVYKTFGVKFTYKTTKTAPENICVNPHEHGTVALQSSLFLTEIMRRLLVMII